MEVEKLAYIAGIVDGEGSIMIQRQASKSFMEQRALRGCFDPHYSPGVRIGMSDRRALDLLVETFGFGKVVEEKSYHHKRPMFRYVVRAKKDVKRFLEPLLPYLIVKKDQAILTLKFIDEWASGSGHYLTSEKRRLRENAWLQMRKLNGVISTPATTKPRGRRGRDKSAPFEAIV